MRYKIKCIFIVGGRERERESVQTRVSKFFWVTHSHFQGYYYYLFIYLISLLRFRVAINSHAKAAQTLLCPQHSQPSPALSPRFGWGRVFLADNSPFIPSSPPNCPFHTFVHFARMVLSLTAAAAVAFAVSTSAAP